MAEEDVIADLFLYGSPPHPNPRRAGAAAGSNQTADMLVARSEKLLRVSRK